MQIVTIGKRRYAAGLWWQVPDRNLDRSLVLTAARTMANALPEEEYNAVVLTGSQFGLGRAEGKGIPRIHALASGLVETTPESWIGCFNLGECWWVCAVHNRLIVSDGDVAVQEYGEASRVFDQLRSKIASAEHIVCETPEDSAAWISERLSRKTPRLRPLHGRPVSDYLPRVLFGGLVLWGIMYGVGLYQEKQALERAIKAQQRAAHSKTRTAEMHQEIKAHPERYFPQVWRLEPTAEAIAEACLGEAIPLYVRGWSFVSRSCTNAQEDRGTMDRDAVYQNITATETVNTLETAITWEFQEGASFISMPRHAVADLADPKRATSVTTRTMHTAVREALPLLPREDASARLYELANRVTGQLSLRWLEPETATVGEKLNIPVIQITSPWIRAEWVITSQGPHATTPQAFTNALRIGLPTHIPGLVITEITQSLNAWTCKGIMYVYQ